MNAIIWIFTFFYVSMLFSLAFLSSQLSLYTVSLHLFFLLTTLVYLPLCFFRHSLPFIVYSITIPLFVLSLPLKHSESFFLYWNYSLHIAVLFVSSCLKIWHNDSQNEGKTLLQNLSRNCEELEKTLENKETQKKYLTKISHQYALLNRFVTTDHSLKSTENLIHKMLFTLKEIFPEEGISLSFCDDSRQTVKELHRDGNVVECFWKGSHGQDIFLWTIANKQALAVQNINKDYRCPSLSQNRYGALILLPLFCQDHGFAWIQIKFSKPTVVSTETLFLLERLALLTSDLLIEKGHLEASVLS